MSSIKDKLNYSLETKELIRQAIIEKGVEVENDVTLREYSEKILDIQSGGISGEAYKKYLLLDCDETGYADNAHTNKYDVANNKKSKFDTFLTYNNGVFSCTQKVVDNMDLFLITLTTSNYSTARSTYSKGRLVYQGGEVISLTTTSLNANEGTVSGVFLGGFVNLNNFYTTTPSSDGCPKQHIKIEVYEKKQVLGQAEEASF